MIEIICDFCGNKMHKEFVHKVEVKPWFEAKAVKQVYRRDFDCCGACARAIEHRLVHIASNYLWRGKAPDRRFKNWDTATALKGGEQT